MSTPAKASGDRKMIIAVDFDGTCVKHDYPNIGDEIGAAPVLKKLVERGDKIILFTMRSGDHLNFAKEWFELNGIPLYGVNENPSQHKWTKSPKPYANIYIDDAALGAPLIHTNSDRPYINWDEVSKLLDIAV